MNEKKLAAISVMLAVSGFSAGAISVSEITQVLGSLTGFVSALAVAYQTVTGAKAQNALTYSNSELVKAQAEKEKAEAKQIEAEIQKKYIENDILEKRNNRHRK